MKSLGRLSETYFHQWFLSCLFRSTLKWYNGKTKQQVQKTHHDPSDMLREQSELIREQPENGRHRTGGAAPRACAFPTRRGTSL